MRESSVNWRSGFILQQPTFLLTLTTREAKNLTLAFHLPHVLLNTCTEREVVAFPRRAHVSFFPRSCFLRPSSNGAKHLLNDESLFRHSLYLYLYLSRTQVKSHYFSRDDDTFYFLVINRSSRRWRRRRRPNNSTALNGTTTRATSPAFWIACETPNSSWTSRWRLRIDK